MTRLAALIGFEWRYHTGQAGFWLASVIFFGLGMFVQGRLGSAALVHVNAPYVIAYAMSMMSLTGVFASMVFCAHAALRDSEHGMTELVYSAPVTKRDFLLARFGGCFAASLCAVGMQAVGMYAATFLPLEAQQLLGPRAIAHYLYVLALIVVPNLLLVAALLFAIATFSRSMIATYVGAMLLYALYWLGAILGGSPMMAQTSPPTAEGMALAALLDPFGISAMLEQTMYWNADEKNAKLISLAGPLLANRLLVIVAAALLLALVYWRFKLRLPGGTGASAGTRAGKSTQRHDPLEPLGAGQAPAYTAVAPPARRLQWRAFMAQLRLELGVVIKGFPFIAMLVIWTFLVASEMFDGLRNADAGSRVLPTTAMLLSRFRFDMLPLFGTLMVIFYSGELVWRERALRFDALLESTPVSGAVFFAAKWVALASLPMLMIVTASACALGFQLASGYAAFEPGLYLSMFYYAGVPLVLMGTLAMFFQVVTRNKYVGMLLSGAVALVLSRNGSGIGIEHPMLHFAQSPGLAYTDMNGYGASATAFHWYMGYWGALVALLGTVALQLWRRGERRAAARRLAGAARQHGARAAALACACIFLASGGFIYYQTNVEGEYVSAAQGTAWRAQYEQRYRKYKDNARPHVVAVRTKVDLYPGTLRYRIEGEYRLRNRSQEPIRELLVAASRQGRDLGISLTGAQVLERDAQFGQTRFRLEPALQPGQETTLRFVTEGRQSPFVASSAINRIDQNGTVMFSTMMLPGIGYNERLELGSDASRARYGLAARPARPRIEAEIAAHKGDFSDSYDWAQFDTVISTDPDQLAFAPGRLERTWNADGRRHFHYRTGQAVRNIGLFLSGRYQVTREMHDGVSVETYSHARHQVNVERMRHAARASLDYFQRQFGRYPHDHLRIVEVPASSGFTGFAAPGTILIGEHGGFTEDLRVDQATDQVTRRIAHEIGHQWWGHQVDPAPIEGGLVLVETLAKYSEMRIVEQVYGKQALQRLTDFELARYGRESARDSGGEMPLYRVQDEGYVMYSKGALVMQSLADSISADAVDAALRTLVQEHAYPRAPGTSLDLIAALVRAAPDQAALIEEAFKQIVIYDLKAGPARYVRLADGRYEIKFEVSARKSSIDEAGHSTDGALSQAFVIGVFADDRKTGQADALYWKAQRVGAGKTAISVIVERKPALVAIEPALRLIERDRRDNFAEPSDGS